MILAETNTPQDGGQSPVMVTGAHARVDVVNTHNANVANGAGSSGRRKVKESCPTSVDQV